MEMAQAASADRTGMTTSVEIPRAYNFAADILASNLAAGRADKAAFIDVTGSWSYRQLADRAARFGAMLRAKGIRREERILICLLDTIDWPTAFLGCLKAGVVAVRPRGAELGGRAEYFSAECAELQAQCP